VFLAFVWWRRCWVSSLRTVAVCTSFATFCYQVATNARLQHALHDVGGVAVRRRACVHVEVHGRRDARVTQARADCVHWHARVGQQRAVRVPGVVQPELSPTQKPRTRRELA
jgi:hypothetical protein